MNEINVQAKQGIGMNQDVIMAKLLSVMLAWRGGPPPADEPQEVEKFREKFERWYYRFIKRHRFLIRRKMSVGQR